ncbi:MAG: hypothetical protein HFG41_01455 [Coprococcus sp.]|nr:hypothetical protein [Coprococcus sp.]
MNYVTKEPIDKGWSSDKKYCVTDENGTRYLLRVSDIQQHDTKQSEFNMMKQAKEVLVWYDNMRNPVPTWYFKG